MTIHSSAVVSAPTALPPTVASEAVQLVDYSRYRFRAEVDWIDLRIATAVPTNFMTVRNRLNVGYVEPECPSAGGACKEFRVRFQAPKSWADLDDRLQKLTVDHPLAEPVSVTGIEIALDAYSRDHSHDDLVEMTVRFYRCASKLVSSNRRASKGKHGSHGLETLPQLRSLIADGYNIYIGNLTDDQRQHIYLKETDNKVMLPIAEHRARTEFTLNGNKIPGQNFGSWKTRDFTEFAHFFKFRRLKDDLPLLVAVPLRTRVQIAEARPHRTARGHLRMSSRSTLADLKLNALAFDALRELSRRWRGEMKTRI